MISPLLTVIQHKTYACTKENMRISPFLWKIFTKLNTVHAMWRWHRRIEVYRQPQNLVQLFLGRAIYSLCNENAVRVAAQCLLTTSRVIKCSEQQGILLRAYQKWLYAIKGHYLDPVIISWEKRPSKIFFSVSFMHHCKEKAFTFKSRIMRIIKCSSELWFEAFKMSMLMMDTLDAICWSPASKEDAKNESLLNIYHCVTHFIDQKDQLIGKLESNKELLTTMLSGGAKDYEHLVTIVTKAINFSDQLIGKSNSEQPHFLGRISHIFIRKSKETLQKISHTCLHPKDTEPSYTPPPGYVSQRHNRKFHLSFNIT